MNRYTLKYNINMYMLTHTYDYVDERGELVAQGCRYIPKDFRPRVPLPGGGFRMGAKGARVVPYWLPELMASESVVLCEGEKDADALAALGVCATAAHKTSPAGPRGPHGALSRLRSMRRSTRGRPRTSERPHERPPPYERAPPHARERHHPTERHHARERHHTRDALHSV